MIVKPDNTYNELRDEIKALEKEVVKLRAENSALLAEARRQAAAFLEELAKYSEDGYRPTSFKFVPDPNLLGEQKLKILYEKE